MSERIEKVFQEVFADDSLQVTDETSYETLPAWDSLAQVRLIVALEEEFGVKFTTDEVLEATSVEGIKSVLSAKGVG
jgi:acyl carrier protein